MGNSKGAIVQGEYAYRVTRIDRIKYSRLHQKALINNVVFAPVFKNQNNDSVDMATWYFSKKKDLDNFLRDISLLN